MEKLKEIAYEKSKVCRNFGMLRKTENNANHHDFAISTGTSASNYMNFVY